MKNKLTDLNDHLFAQLERLSDEDLSGEKLEQEIQRTKSIAQVANGIITNGRLLLDAKKEFGNRSGTGSELLGLEQNS